MALSSQKSKVQTFLAFLSRFSIVGLMSTVTYFVASNILLANIDIDPASISVMAYCAGMVVSFLGHKLFTFRVPDNWNSHIARFLFMSVSGLAISYFGMWIITEVVGAAAFWGTVAISLTIPVYSFVIMNLWVFRNRD